MPLPAAQQRIFFGGLIADGRADKELLVEDLGCLEMAGGWAQGARRQDWGPDEGGWGELGSFCPAIADWASWVGPAAWLAQGRFVQLRIHTRWLRQSARRCKDVAILPRDRSDKQNSE